MTTLSTNLTSLSANLLFAICFVSLALPKAHLWLHPNTRCSYIWLELLSSSIHQCSRVPSGKNGFSHQRFDYPLWQLTALMPSSNTVNNMEISALVFGICCLISAKQEKLCVSRLVCMLCILAHSLWWPGSHFLTSFLLIWWFTSRRLRGVFTLSLLRISHA